MAGEALLSYGMRFRQPDLRSIVSRYCDAEMARWQVQWLRVARLVGIRMKISFFELHSRTPDLHEWSSASPRRPVQRARTLLERRGAKIIPSSPPRSWSCVAACYGTLYFVIVSIPAFWDPRTLSRSREGGVWMWPVLFAPFMQKTYDVWIDIRGLL